MRLLTYLVTIGWTIALTAHQPWPYNNIHILGDSHGAYCFTQRPWMIPFHYTPPAHISLYETSQLTYPINNKTSVSTPLFIHWLQGRTMHRVGRDGLQGLNFKNYNINENDVTVFVLGWIDVAAHIYRDNENSIIRQISERNLDEVLETLVSNYMQTLLANQQQYKKLTIVVFAVLPPKANDVIESAFISPLPNSSYIQTQIVITNKLNNKLEEQCRKHSFIYMNVNQHYQNPRGDFNMNLAGSPEDHHIHPQHNQLVKDTLFKLLLDAASK